MTYFTTVKLTFYNLWDLIEADGPQEASKDPPSKPSAGATLMRNFKYITLICNTLYYNVIYYNVIHYYVIHFNTMYSSIKYYDIVQYNTLHYNKVNCN